MDPFSGDLGPNVTEPWEHLRQGPACSDSFLDAINVAFADANVLRYVSFHRKQGADPRARLGPASTPWFEKFRNLREFLVNQ
jgi:hypothetical protein